jgi:hypothetical protein
LVMEHEVDGIDRLELGAVRNQRHLTDGSRSTRVRY